MNKTKTVEDFIAKYPNWKKELEALRAIMLKTEMEECVKWGMPAYTVNGKNVIGLGAFKSYVGIWFHQGCFLTNEEDVLVNAQEGKTKAMRQWRFANAKEMNKKLIKKYVLEAIENQKQGKEVKPAKPNTSVPESPLLNEVMKKNSKLKTAYDAMTPGKRREYAKYIIDAKREATKASRLEKIIPMILAGGGLNDMYK